MKPLLAILILFISSLGFLHAEESAQSPIVVVMPHESPYRPEVSVNGKPYSFGGFKQFLTDAANQSGSKDPVIIRLYEDNSIHMAIILVKIAHQTHDNVSLEICPPKDVGVRHIIQIPKAGLKTILDERTVGSSPAIIPDPNPNGQRDRQMQRLNNLQKGIIETK